jgi:hypothetical protein
VSIRGQYFSQPLGSMASLKRHLHKKNSLATDLTPVNADKTKRFICAHLWPITKATSSR